MKLTADKLTIAKLEGLVGPAAKWHGRCFEIATATAKLLGQDAVAVYGHYLGYVDELRDALRELSACIEKVV